MTGRSPLPSALQLLRAALAAAPALRAVAFFGSAREGRTWTHSDIDLIGIVDKPGGHWQSHRLGWQGWDVQLQTLSRRTLVERTRVNRGSGLARSLAGAEVWFDRDGLLTEACARLAHFDPNARDLSVLRETAKLIAALHDCERHLHHQHRRSARLKLVEALAHRCALRRAESGQAPLREPWDEAGPERDQVDALWSGAALLPILQDAWREARYDLGPRCAAMLQMVDREGPLTAAELSRRPLFRGMRFSDRLMVELVAAGLLRRTTVTDPVVGLPELRFERTRRGKPDVFPGGDSTRFLDRATIEDALADRPKPPQERGRVLRISRRLRGGARALPKTARLTVEGGLEGDAWARRRKHRPDEQLAVMEAPVAEILANGQPIEILGDNLFVDFDLSETNLPVGSRLRVGRAEVVVSPEPHDGCNKFAARLGKDALAAVADRKHRWKNRRGVYWRVVESGEVSVGDTIALMKRGPSD